MKKLILAFFLYMSIICTASAPPMEKLYLPAPTKITFVGDAWYEPLMEAIYTYESGRDTTRHNLAENAVGGFQIRPCRIEHYNQLNGTNYTLEDCHDLTLSKRVFLYFTNHDGAGHVIPRKSWEQAAKDWNGSGPATDIYWTNVNNLI